MSVTAILTILAPWPASAQTPTVDPSAWRPFSYADLRQSSGATATYADIWKDALLANNRAYLGRGDTRYGPGNAPATEAHYVIWSPQKSVVLSILDTATGCTMKEARSTAHATVKFCPLRIAIYEGIRVRTTEGGRACMLELDPAPAGATPDPTSAVAYASYDVATKTIRTGLIVDHHAIEGCSTAIPLPRS